MYVAGANIIVIKMADIDTRDAQIVIFWGDFPISLDS